LPSLFSDATRISSIVVLLQTRLALQLHFLLTSESMRHHDSEDHVWLEH
jgi:hypothetical protein